MNFPEDKNNLVVGFKQVKKAILAGVCERIYLSDDCTLNISDNLRSISGNIEIVRVPTMHELGNLCGIDVSASCAAQIRL